MKNLFTGKWFVVSCRNGLRLSRSEQGFPAWEFLPQTHQQKVGHRLIIEGTLREHRLRSEPFETLYTYYANRNHLFIDRSQIEPDGRVQIAYADCYRIESIDSNTLRLYDL